jgi:hypothetical protein
MILFKRVGESFRHIEDREWVLLFLETLGVLVGILLAFELQEWAQRRSEAAKHRQLMDRLFEESQRDVATLRDDRDRMRAFGKAEEEFATALSNGRCPPEPSWRAVYTVNFYPAFEAPRTVYHELMGAGGLSSIEDPVTRKQIANFNSSLEWSESQNEYFRALNARRDIIPLEDKRIRLRLDPAADEPEVARYDRASLCADQGFRNRIIDATRDHLVAVSWHDGVTAFAIYMCATLGENVGRRCRPSFGGDLTGEDLRDLQKAIARDHESKD